MTLGLLGTKLGMTREFLKTGQSVPVTVIKIEKARVLDVITKEKRGYSALKVGFFKIKNSTVSMWHIKYKGYSGLITQIHSTMWYLIIKPH